jgi:hypothetical protein
MTFSNAMLEKGSTATDYEPYHGTTYPISWQTEAGTVYGGTLDVVSGEMTVDRAYYAFNGTEYWFKSGTALNGYYTYHLRDMVSADKKMKPYGTAISDKFELADNTDVYFQNYGKFLVDNAFNFNVNPSEGATDVASFKTWLSTTPVEVCYELATPQTYQLTPTEIALLQGQNNVWADTGDTEVTYKADIQGYIDKKINALI